MRLNIISTIAAVALLASLAVARTPYPDASLASFKHDLKPKVGKRITITGTLRSAKLGWLVMSKDWSIYIYATGDSNRSRMNALEAFNEKSIKVTGTLRYNPGTQSDQTIAATVPEHFFFDVAEAKVTRWSQPRTKKPTSNRVKQAMRP
jgi:hypothetical protein